MLYRAILEDVLLLAREQSKMALTLEEQQAWHNVYVCLKGAVSSPWEKLPERVREIIRLEGGHPETMPWHYHDCTLS